MANVSIKMSRLPEKGYMTFERRWPRTIVLLRRKHKVTSQRSWEISHRAPLCRFINAVVMFEIILRRYIMHQSDSLVNSELIT